MKKLTPESQFLFDFKDGKPEDLPQVIVSEEDLLSPRGVPGRSLDFEVAPPTSRPQSDSGKTGPLFEIQDSGRQPQATPEQTEASQLRTFYTYLKNLNLKPEDLRGKSILDVGASSGSFGDIAARFGAKVVSIDSGKPKYSEDVLEGDSQKIFLMPAEHMNLAERLGVSSEPKFDYIFSHYSTPYVFVNEEQDKNGKWKTKKSPLEWRLEMITKIHSAVSNIYRHLKVGGEAVLFPLFLDLEEYQQKSVDFGNGEIRDVREFNGVVHEVLADLANEYVGSFDIKFETVPQKDGYQFTRLIIYKN